MCILRVKNVKSSEVTLASCTFCCWLFRRYETELHCSKCFVLVWSFPGLLHISISTGGNFDCLRWLVFCDLLSSAAGQAVIRCRANLLSIHEPWISMIFSFGLMEEKDCISGGSSAMKLLLCHLTPFQTPIVHCLTWHYSPFRILDGKTFRQRRNQQSFVAVGFSNSFVIIFLGSFAILHFWWDLDIICFSLSRCPIVFAHQRLAFYTSHGVAKESQILGKHGKPVQVSS